MSFTAEGPLVWPVPADWGRPVREGLAWLTEAMVAPTYGVSQKRQLRLAPRRSFDFDVVADAGDRRLLDMLRFDGGERQWLLPIWPDGQLLLEGLAVGGTFIACRTAGFDFVEGGLALLWRSPDVWEVASVATVGGEGLTVAALASAWPAGTRLWPLRKARMGGLSKESAWHDDASRLPMQFRIDEACDWPAMLPATTYLGTPVLTTRPDAGTATEADFARFVEEVDNQTGAITSYDTVGLPSRHQDHIWRLFGREEQGAFRSLLYGLAGRAGNLWVPSWGSDLKLAAPIGASATAITVEWCGYTLYGREQIGRRDLRIELAGGATFYRRIESSAEAGGNEVLGLDSALGVDVALGQVRCISFLTFSQLASDTVEIEHVTDGDGFAQSRTRWEGLRDV